MHGGMGFWSTARNATVLGRRCRHDYSDYMDLQQVVSGNPVVYSLGVSGKKLDVTG